ncbi:hypothetical protein HDV06_000714 [Boothiomyces sp. JEL0866]|nr:hypothetical protein HDV06_000714 [Boothiomyces sp. JEL0866]
MKKLFPQKSHNEISKLLGDTWKSLPQEERESYRIKANEFKREHEIKYPNYQFRRRLPGEIKRRNYGKKSTGN